MRGKSEPALSYVCACVCHWMCVFEPVCLHLSACCLWKHTGLYKIMCGCRISMCSWHCTWLCSAKQCREIRHAAQYRLFMKGLLFIKLKKKKKAVGQQMLWRDLRVFLSGLEVNGPCWYLFMWHWIESRLKKVDSGQLHPQVGPVCCSWPLTHT